jgi:hypothetical protein
MPRNQLIDLRHDTAADWTSADPILADGEPGYETNTGKVKIGDGINHWSALPYLTDAAAVAAIAAAATAAGVLIATEHTADNALYEQRANNLSDLLSVPTALTNLGLGSAAAAPTTGTWAVGNRFFNSTPVASGKIGWVCTTGGTPGTWKAFGAIDA